MKNPTLVLNGQFFIQKTTGQQRYAKELLNELDKIIQSKEIKIIVPKSAKVPKYTNIEVIRYGSLKNRLWEQICLPLYLWKTKSVALSFCNTTPFLCPGPTVIHDTIIQEHPEYFTTVKGKVVRFYYNKIFKKIEKSGFPVITVTEFSKRNINRIHHILLEKIFVISNAWQHFEPIKENHSFFEGFPEIKENEYFFALGSLAAQKNFEWIYKNALFHPEQKFVIAGKAVKNYRQKESVLRNVIYLGYISDENIKTLMFHCKAFVFPSLEEGFGIPPLEALSVGAKVVSSNSSCLPEVLGNAVYYIDPKNPNVNLDEIISKPILQDSKEILAKYSWKKSAEKLYEFIKKSSLEV